MKISLQFNCPAKWSSMFDCGRSRFCSRCSKEVHDISQLSEAEAIEVFMDPESCSIVELNESKQIRTLSGFSTALLLSTAVVVGCQESAEPPPPAAEVPAETSTAPSAVADQPATASGEEASGFNCEEDFASDAALVDELAEQEKDAEKTQAKAEHITNAAVPAKAKGTGTDAAKIEHLLAAENSAFTETIGEVTGSKTQKLVGTMRVQKPQPEAKEAAEQ